MRLLKSHPATNGGGAWTCCSVAMLDAAHRRGAMYDPVTCRCREWFRSATPVPGTGQSNGKPETG